MTLLALLTTFNNASLFIKISLVLFIANPLYSANKQITFAASFGIYDLKSYNCNESEGASFHISLWISQFSSSKHPIMIPYSRYKLYHLYFQLVSKNYMNKGYFYYLLIWIYQKNHQTLCWVVFYLILLVFIFSLNRIFLCFNFNKIWIYFKIIMRLIGIL